MISTLDLFSIDAETSSAADLEKVGAYRYLTDSSTIALMLAFHPVGDPSPPRLWCAGDPIPDEFVAHVRRGGSFTGWNVILFDRIGYRHLLVPLGWPEIDDANWRDSMQLAAAGNLPRSLDGCARAVGIPHDADLKDKQRIKRITNQTKTPITHYPDGRIVFGDRTDLSVKPDRIAAWNDDMRWLEARCVQDVVLEEANMLRLPPWPDVNPWITMPYVDRAINDRGVRVDLPLVAGMARAAEVETARLDDEMDRITKGAVPKSSTVEKLKQWLVSRGVDVPRKQAKKSDEEEIILDGETDDEDEGRGSDYRLRKNDIANLLAGELPDDGNDPDDQWCRRTLWIRIETAKASARKLKRIMLCADANGDVRGFLSLLGAQATGRYGSPGVQWHNMVRDAFAKDYEGIAAANGLDSKQDKAVVRKLAANLLATAIEVGRVGDADLIRFMFETKRRDLQGRERIEGVLPWISRMSRRVVAAATGETLLNGDFANIQARIPVWLAGQTETVEQFRRGEDLYRIQASPIYGKPPESLSAEERQIGKVCRLFLSFLAGPKAFIPACMVYGLSIPFEMAKRFVEIFRETNKPLVDFFIMSWQSAVWAVQYPGREFVVPPTNMVSWFTYSDCLCCRLPSGRLLHYWHPRVQQGYWDDGTPKKQLDLIADVVKGPFVFRRNLWAGLLAQNLTCAIEADLLNRALLNMHEAAIPVRLHVHDNVCASVPEDQAEDLMPMFKQCMLTHDAWVGDLPVAVDVDISARFG